MHQPAYMGYHSFLQGFRAKVSYPTRLQVYELYNLKPFSLSNIGWAALARQAGKMLAVCVVCSFGSMMDITAVQVCTFLSQLHGLRVVVQDGLHVCWQATVCLFATAAASAAVAVSWLQCCIAHKNASRFLRKPSNCWCVQAELPQEIDADREVAAVGAANLSAGLLAGGGTGAHVILLAAIF